MSYEINNYCFLGMPVSDIINELPASIEVTICESGICVLIDKKFAALAGGVKNFSMNFEYPTLDQMVSEGYFDVPYGSSGGPNSLFCRLLLMTAGITDSKFFEGWNNILDSLVSELKFLPVDIVHIEVNGNPSEFGLVHVENRFLIDLAKCFAESSELSILNTNKYNEKRDIVNLKCLKNTLNILLKLHSDLKEKCADNESNKQQVYSLEFWMHYFLDKYLESKGCYCDIQVASTYYGNVHKLGGMEYGVPYVIFNDMQRYDEDGWTDPREVDSESVIKVRNCLLGDNSTRDWEKYTPQFGG